MDFSTLELHPDMQRALAEAGYQSTMPVQEQVIANAFSGRDLYVQSQTGTGKTAAYLIVIFQRLLSEPLLNSRKALIMVPTRELAVQVEDEAKLIGKYLPFKTGSFYGGVGYGAQQQLLREDAQIMVGTPGRVLDLNASGAMNLMNIAFLVLDEADRMFDMGFYPDLRKLIKVVPPANRRQTMLFSATLNSYIKNLAWEYTKDPIEIEIESDNITVDEIDQVLYHVPSSDKFKLLLGIFEREQPESAIVFCNTKHYTETIARRLRANGIPAEFISGDLPQNKRLKIIDEFKAGTVRFLVATDVAARGLDIEGLSLVVNFDLPNEKENYVHRIGRTARAGKSGKAITLASEQDVYELGGIEKYIEQKIPSVVVSPEMYGEDKGKKDERGGRRNPRGEQRRSNKEGPSGNNAGAGDAAPPRSKGPAASKKRRDAFPLPPRSHSMSKSAASQTGNADAGVPNVLALPMDDRIAYYKQKYGGAPPAEHKQRTQKQPAAGGTTQEKGNAQKGQKKNNKRKHKRGGSGVDRGSGYEARGGSVDKKQPNSQASGSAPQKGVPPAKNKGILAKLKNLFKK